MEKLVLVYEYGDGCSYGGTETLPFEYESIEKATEDFLTLWEERKSVVKCFNDWRRGKTLGQLLGEGQYAEEYRQRVAANDHYPYITFMGTELEVGEEIPNILTLEDWFEQNKRH